MAALSGKRMAREKNFKSLAFPLATGAKAWEGGIACGDTADGTVKQAQALTTLVKIGEFVDSFDNTSGSNPVNVLVRLDKEIVAQWYDNDPGGGAIVAADLFQDAYLLDDHTVTLTSTGHSKAGRIWAVDSVKGVLVENYTL